MKSMLYAAVFGPSADPQYEFGALFEAQVEPHNRDFAIKAGKHATGLHSLVPMTN